MRSIKIAPKQSRFYRTEMITLTGKDASGKPVSETMQLVKKPGLLVWFSGIFTRPKYIKEIKINL